MKICYCTARESPSDAFRHRLEALEHELIDTATVAAGESSAQLCLLLLPPALGDAAVMIREHRQLLAGDLPLLVCGLWEDPDSVSQLLAAGADDYVSMALETQQLGLRLHIFVQQSARHSTSAEAARQEDRLVRAQRLETLASLTGSIAHDYNNLLSAIQGNAELALMDMSLDAPVRYSLEQINSAAHRAAEITRQILAFRGGGATAKSIQPLNLSQLIREMGELLRVSVSRNCRLEYRLGRTLPLVEGDPLRLRQVVMTLVTNASAVLGHGGGLIQVRTSRTDGDDGSTVVLAVQAADTGRHRDKDSAFPNGESADSGLAAARVIAREHGAEITWNADGSGGTHRLVFAVSGGPSPELEVGAMLGEHGRSAGTVLLIDDEEAVRVAAHRLLRRAGYTVFEAASGDEGLAVTAQVAAALDAVLVDLNMPGLECRELLEQLRRIRPDLRLVVWSGFPEEAARERLAGVPDVTFIEKPTQLGELAATLQRVLKT